MSYSEILKRMKTGGLVLIDGATGTELERRGAEMNDAAWCGPANLYSQKILEEVHLDYIRAGAEIIITNTYATSRLMLEPAGYSDRIREIYKNACQAALDARAKSGNPGVLIAGSLSHMVPIAPGASNPVTGSAAAGETEHSAAAEDPFVGLGRTAFTAALKESADMLAEGGCDFIMLEMLYHPERVKAALDAALSTGLPVWAGFSVRSGADKEILGHHPDIDIPFQELISLLPEEGVDAAGIMHSSTNITGPALQVLKRHFPGPVFAYPDSGYFKMPNWQFEDIIPPEELRKAAETWISQGLGAVGGCCGLSLEHIKALEPLKR